MSIQGQLLDVTVVGCSKLKDTEWISRQDPYVLIEYATTKFRTRTCTDGGKHPTFQEKIIIPLIEGLREISVAVWNSNTLTFDDFIGSGRVQLHKVLTQGYDDSSWPLQTKSGKFAGEVKLIMHFAPAAHHHQQQQQQYSHQPHMGHESNYLAGRQSQLPPYMPMVPPSASFYAPQPAYTSMDAYPAPAPAPYPAAYPPMPYSSAAYPPAPYPPATYPPQPYPPTSPSPYYGPGPYPECILKWRLQNKPDIGVIVVCDLYS